MTIDISDSLLDCIKVEISSSLQSAESLASDLFDYEEEQAAEPLMALLKQAESALLIISEKPAADLCRYISSSIKNIKFDDKPTNIGDNLTSGFLVLSQYVSNISPKKSPYKKHLEVVSDCILNNLENNSSNRDIPHTELIFPVNKETLETIAFLVKKELATTKSLFEEALERNTLNDKSTHSSLIESLVLTEAAVKMIAFEPGLFLIDQAKNALLNDNTLTSNELFAKSMVLIEDSLLQLDFINEQELITEQGYE